MDKNNIVAYLKKYKLPITENRVKVLECLMDGVHFHSINDIIEHNKSMNVKSVYNTIKSFIELGAVDSYSFSGITKYALPDSSAESKFSVHIVNQKDEVEHIELDEVIYEKIKSEVEKNNKAVKNIKIFVHTEE